MSAAAAAGGGRRRRLTGDHQANAERVHRIATIVVRPLCAPAFTAAALWAGLLATHAAAILPYRVAAIATLGAPVFLAAGTVLTAVASVHRGFRDLRRSWAVIGSAAACAAFAMVALARHGF